MFWIILAITILFYFDFFYSIFSVIHVYRIIIIIISYLGALKKNDMTRMYATVPLQSYHHYSYFLLFIIYEEQKAYHIKPQSCIKAFELENRINESINSI